METKVHQIHALLILKCEHLQVVKCVAFFFFKKTVQFQANSFCLLVANAKPALNLTLDSCN